MNLYRATMLGSISKRYLLPPLCGILLLSGCERPQIQVYEVPKETPPADPATNPDMPLASKPQLDWETPEQWRELPATAIRLGNFLYSDDANGEVEITVSSIPGLAGGLLANVNRWLGQIGREPIEAKELESIVESTRMSDRPVSIVDLKVEQPTPESQRIYAAVFDYSGFTWFVKMTGSHQGVESQIPVFREFADNLAFSQASTASARMDNSPEELYFDVPEGWERSEGSPLRYASFRIAKEGLPPADFSITRFPGDAGGLAANVNRWRRQLGLEPWDNQQLAERAKVLQANGLEITTFDLKPESPEEKEKSSERILAAILQHNNASWFFKLRGDTFLLETQRRKLNSLLRSLRFDNQPPAPAEDL